MKWPLVYEPGIELYVETSRAEYRKTSEGDLRENEYFRRACERRG